MGWDVTLRAVLSLIVVLGLIAGAGALVRRYGAQGGLALRKGGKRRLSVVESLPIDNRRRLLLVRKDQAEHLVLVGGANDLHLESKPAFILEGEAE